MKYIKKIFNNKYRLFSLLFFLIILVVCNITYFKTYSERIIDFASDPDYLETQVNGNIVYINDLDSDYYYYMGLNYTSNDGTIPTKENKNIYNDSNLVQVKITYQSEDDNGLKGYVSLTERQDKFIYFKTFAVNDNGTSEDLTDDYITIDLIDNPFTDRPTNQGFNGWICKNSNVTISYDDSYYERSAKIPVTYDNGKPNKIDVTFIPSWVDASVVMTNGSWSISGLNEHTMIKINSSIITYAPYSMAGYYKKVILNSGDSLRGYYSSTGSSLGGGIFNSNCNWWSDTWNGSGCEVYELITNEYYSPNNTYYELVNESMQEVDEASLDLVIESETVNEKYENLNMASYYRLDSLSSGDSLEGYYSETGEKLSGLCTSNCNYYKLLQYSDNVIMNDTDNFYYLATRDTNIIVVNSDINGSWSNNTNIPFTVTGMHNQTSYGSVWTTDSAINCYDDVTIENVTLIYSSNHNGTYNPPTGSSTNGTLFGRYNNIKIGRGITIQRRYSLLSIVGGNGSNTGQRGNATKYKIIIESGKYNSISLSTGASNYSYSNIYINNKSVYGSDYDRAKQDNDKLDIYYCASGSWSGSIYGSDTSSTSKDVLFDLTVKSGKFGSSKLNLTTGIYIGGRFGGTQYAVRQIKVEGGYIYNLIGGPISSTNRSNQNDIYIYMTGGTVDMITAGAGLSATYGNRIVQVTGGIVNYSVFGGSNGEEGSAGDGTLNGSTYVYIGGNSVIGNEEYIERNLTLWGAEAGSVFGNGNGNSSADSIGSCDNSTIIIDENAIVNQNVYGGGNYGATGISSSSSSSTTNIVINNGIVKGSVYGGGNKNGAGSSGKSASISIEMYNGLIIGSLYGGSNEEGTIYGNVDILVAGGEISSSVYGGGRGGIDNNSNGTYVQKEVNIIIGNAENQYIPIINEAVYGGSAFGTVNGITNSTNLSADNTSVTINKGIINNVFGGGQGSADYTPYVLGNTSVIINDGTINNVFGGNDKKGSPNGTISVTINGGEITNTYGGGNETGASITNVYLNGGTSTYIFGGSNLSGDVATSNVITTGGNCNTLYGGNNEGGQTNTTNITVNGGNITTVFGGGEKTSVSQSTNVEINSDVVNVFGGSNKNGDIPITNITINDGIIDSVYGANNEGGFVNETNVSLYGKYINNVYGGGLKATTGTSNINAFSGGISNIYGGGSEAGLTTSNVNIGSSVIGNVYGGSNLSGNVTDSYISNITGAQVNDNIDVSVSFAESSQYPTNHTSSQNIQVEISNQSSSDITNWNLFIMTSEGVIGANWSSAYIEKINGGYLITEKNQYYGTNIISSGSSYSFDFHAFSDVEYDDFVIYSVYFIGTDSNNNKYSSKIKVDNIYGANNEGGFLTNSHINLTTGIVDNIYGGGNKAQCNITNVNINNVSVTNSLFGGGNEASVNYSNVSVLSSTIGSESANGYVYGGGNKASVNNNINLLIDNNTYIYGNVFGGGNQGTVNGVITANISNSTVTEDIYGAGNKAEVGSTDTQDVITLNLTNVNAKNVYGGANAALTTGNINLNISSSNINQSIYGAGNGVDSVVSGDTTGELNPAKVNGNVNVVIADNTQTTNVYGGGNLGLVEKNTNLKLSSSSVLDSIYGGGNAAIVKQNTYVYLTNANISNSAYAGGNGTTAIVYGNTNLDIDNNSIITNHVFGGGNAAQTGNSANNNSQSIVNIAGATIGKNVYGGANTSVLYGYTTVNIGIDKVSNPSLIKSDISIGGTVFGGGEANASGSEIYDFTFISVTKGIVINIDGNNHNNLVISGSIFGSGNASSTQGYSYINIYNYGTKNNVMRNISIQRASKVTLNNSYILLAGATDRTNEYSNVLFSLSRLDELIMKNNSSLYLQTGANLVKKFKSVDENDNIAYATIDNETETFSRNVNNRLYMLAGKNLNIATNENVTEYGEVLGMTFFGMFTLNNGNIVTALYDDYTYNQTISSGDIYYFTDGSYVLGKHLTNHDIKVNGFYSNYGTEDNKVIIKYIEPTPADSDFYMWTIGEVVASYEVDLTASKYSTLGAKELPLINHTNPNTTFSILGVNFSNLNENIELVNYKDIPRVAANEEDADNIFGINMKNSTTGWLTNGSSNFITEGDVNVTGTIDYIKENLNSVPSFVFYLYHSKNIKTSGDMGSITISLVAITPIDDLNNNVERININVNLSKALYNTNDYEGTITPGKNYEMFPTSSVNITTKSSFSTYYSLYMESDTSPYQTGYYRSLVSTYVLPVGTKITMIDLHDTQNPVYYYYIVDETMFNQTSAEYNLYQECSYKLSNFIKMGSTSSSNKYDDSQYNNNYYDSITKVADEEFIFIVDFIDTNITENVSDKTLLIELRNADDQTLISVLGIEQQTLKYSLYTSSDAYIDITGTIDKTNIYLSDSALMTITNDFVEEGIVKDTTYNDEKLGLKISIYDENNNLLSAQDLMGVSFTYKNSTYYPNSSGITRIKISEKIGNVLSYINFDTGTSSLATGDYKIVLEAFGSYDGIYYSSVSPTQIEFNVHIIDTPYGLKINAKDNIMFVDKTTGNTYLGNNFYLFKVYYNSNLTNPNLRIKLLRRKYDNIYTYEYDEVDLKNYVTNNFANTINPNEYILSTNPIDGLEYNLMMKDSLVSGTYKILVSLYDGDNKIGDTYEYMIIK